MSMSVAGPMGGLQADQDEEFDDSTTLVDRKVTLAACTVAMLAAGAGFVLVF